MSEDLKNKLNVETAKARLRALWEGQVPLFETFWLYYFAAVVVLTILSSALFFIYWPLYLITLGWAGFMVRPIWKAADHYQGEKIWAILAKIAAILIALMIFRNLIL